MYGGRLVADGFLLLLWIWLVCTGFVLLNVYFVSEAVDRNAPLEKSETDIHFWHFIGVPVFSLVFVSIFMVPCGYYIKPPATYIYSGPAYTLFDSAKWLGLWCLFVIYVLICTTGFFKPYTDFREVELAERGIAGTQAPGWAPINCLTDKNPGSIDVRTDLYSYFVLADPQWSVAGKVTSVAKEEKWRWLVAPIVYNGPIEGCRTKYPLFAVCIDNSNPVSLTKCWWDNERRGAWTHMRLMTASHEIEPGEMKKFWDEWVPNPYNTSERVKLHHENLFQYNTPSYDETVAFLEYKRNEYYTLKWEATVGWFAATVPFALAAFLVFVRRVVAHYPSAKAKAKEPASCQDVPSSTTAPVPSASTTAPQGGAPYGTEEEMSTSPEKDDGNAAC